MSAWTPIGRSSHGPSLHGVPRVFLPDSQKWPKGSYLCLRRPSGVDVIGDLRIPVVRGRSPNQAQITSPKFYANVDASGRYALGIHEAISDAGEEVEVLALHRSWSSALRELIARPFGVRYVVLRVSKAFPIDVERPVVRCQRQVFDLLGCDSGDRVVMVSARIPSRSSGDVSPGSDGAVGDGDTASDSTRAVWTTVSAQAFEASDTDVAERFELEVANPDAALPWLSPRLSMGMTIDVPRAFMPAEMRDALGAAEGGVVLMRREIRSLFGRNFREFGLLVLLSGLAMSQLPIPIEPGWGAAATFLAASLLLGLAITGGSIRSKVRVGRIKRTHAPRWPACIARSSRSASDG